MQHLNTELANSIRSRYLAGTTSQGSTKHLVFHIDQARNYALLKVPGSSYYSRGSQYVSGRIKLIWLNQQGTAEGYEVWSTARDENGVLTPNKATELIARIDSEIDSLTKYEEFKTYCANNVGKPVTRVKLTIGWAYEIDQKRFLIKNHYNFPFIKKVNSTYKATSEAYEAELVRQAAVAVEAERLAFARQWLAEFEASTDKIAKVLELKYGL